MIALLRHFVGIKSIIFMLVMAKMYLSTPLTLKNKLSAMIYKEILMAKLSPILCSRRSILFWYTAMGECNGLISIILILWKNNKSLRNHSTYKNIMNFLLSSITHSIIMNSLKYLLHTKMGSSLS